MQGSEREIEIKTRGKMAKSVVLADRYERPFSWKKHCQAAWGRKLSEDDAMLES